MRLTEAGDWRTPRHLNSDIGKSDGRAKHDATTAGGNACVRRMVKATNGWERHLPLSPCVLGAYGEEEDLRSPQTRAACSCRLLPAAQLPPSLFFYAAAAAFTTSYLCSRTPFPSRLQQQNICCEPRSTPGLFTFATRACAWLRLSRDAAFLLTACLPASACLSLLAGIALLPRAAASSLSVPLPRLAFVETFLRGAVSAGHRSSA